MGQDSEKQSKRPAIPVGEAWRVWVAAAGRCTFCNQYVLENEVLGEAVRIGELAHNVGWGPNSPRSEGDMPEEERQEAENLLLACRNCHKPVDDKGVVGRYNRAELTRRKLEHETRIRMLTEIGADRAAVVVRLAGKIRSYDPAISRDTVLEATTAAGLYPHLLTGKNWQGLELDLRNMGDADSSDYYTAVQPLLRALASQVLDGAAHDQIDRVAIFGFARIPVLIAFGALLGDKLQTFIFQRHRVDGVNAWRWPADPGPAAWFEVVKLRDGEDPTAVALTVSLSAPVDPAGLPEEFDARYTLYDLRPVAPATAGTELISRPETLAQFEQVLRAFLTEACERHSDLASIALFPAAGVAPSLSLGRVPMPDVHPAWRVFDRLQDGYFEALEVRT